MVYCVISYCLIFFFLIFFLKIFFAVVVAISFHIPIFQEVGPGCLSTETFVL